MTHIAHLEIVNYAPNLQSPVSKLPTNLQNKWRDRVSNQVATFQVLAGFVDSAAYAANDPVFGKEALRKSKESSKDS